MVNLNGQLDWIWNQLQDTPTGGSMRLFQEGLTERKATTPAAWAITSS